MEKNTKHSDNFLLHLIAGISMRAGSISYNDHTAYSISNILNDELEIHHWGKPERAPHDQSNVHIPYICVF